MRASTRRPSLREKEWQTLRSRHAPSRHVRSTDTRALISAGALIAAGVALALSDGPGEPAVVAVMLGAGLCLSTATLIRPRRVRAALLVALLTAFVAGRLGALGSASHLSFGRVLLVLVEGMIVGVAYQLAYSHGTGLAEVATLFRGPEAGYAPVLDETTVARSVESELSRSRRAGTPLTFLLLEPGEQAAGPALDAVVSQLSTRALTELERIYARERGCRLISEQVRRSDVVTCASAERFLVLSTDTSAAATVNLANRVVEAVKAELGIELRPGIAEFPADGTTYGDLIAAAKSAADRDGVIPLNVRPLVAAPDPEPPTPSRTEANP